MLLDDPRTEEKTPVAYDIPTLQCARVSRYVGGQGAVRQINRRDK